MLQITQSQTSRGFEGRWLFYAFVPFGVFSLAMLSEYSGFDVWMSGHFYDSAAGDWMYRRTYVMSHIFHDAGRHLIVVFALLNLGLIVASYHVDQLKPYRRHLWYVLAAAACGPAIVSILKSTTHIYTPWDLQLFGGQRPYVRLFDSAPIGLPAGHAFPGGHSSGGFAYIGLYFLLTVHGHPWRYRVLALVLLLGGIFGFTQEVRGAHFLSHDLLSFCICWSVSLVLALLVYRREIADAFSRIESRALNVE